MRQFLKNHWVETVIFVIGLTLIHAFLLSPAFWGGHGIRQIDANTASQFGQFIAGYLGTMFLLGSVIAIVATFRWQVETSRRTAFETRFFELLKYHRENVAEIALGKRHGRRTFVLLVSEFREVLNVVEETLNESGVQCDAYEKVNVAYLAFYYGTGPNSDPVLREALRQHHIDFVTALVSKLSEDDRKRRVQQVQNFAFVPFEGHQSRLAHYYRHLYQTVQYIKNHLGVSAGLQYVDILRAQLTNHEQALIYVNSLSDVGAPWKEQGLLEDFQLIKNIPRGFFNSVRETDPAVTYPKIKFEYAKGRANAQPNRE
jgi:hypothetical protein